jgi:hypothetical protein
MSFPQFEVFGTLKNRRTTLEQETTVPNFNPPEGSLYALFFCEYRTWDNMKGRCYNEKATGYENYGGRGIKVCSRWRNSFRNFLEDMGPRPSDKHSIDRFPDKDGDYKPGNCRWATRSEQASNLRPYEKKRSKKITHLGKTKSVDSWAKENGISPECLRQRLRRGYPMEVALSHKKGSHYKRR